MISNYHTASGPPGASYYMAGFDDHHEDNYNNNNNSSKNSASKKGVTNIKNKNKRGMRSRFFGGGRNKKGSNNGNGNEMKMKLMSSSDASQGGQSLSYSSASSVQSIGETTASSHFSGILRVLDDEDEKELLRRQYYTKQNSSGQVSVGGSSLQYSDSDTSYTTGRGSRASRGGASQRSVSSMDYSTDQESQLEGSKLIQMLLDE